MLIASAIAEQILGLPRIAMNSCVSFNWCPQSLFIPSLPVCESHNFPKVSFLSPRLMDQQIVISTLYHPSLPNVQWRLSIVTHCNLWLFIYPCILFTSTKHLRTNILTSGSVFPLYPSLRYTYIAHCF